jgi:hypothetical protein
MRPLDYLPFWGREGVSLIAFLKRMESDRSSTDPKNNGYRVMLTTSIY